MNPQDAARAVDIVRKIKDMGLNALGGVGKALDAIPPSVDILPGPIDNLAFMGLAGINKGIKSLTKVDDVERGVVGAVKAVKNINKVDDLERGVVNSVKAVRELPPVEGGVSKGLEPLAQEARKYKSAEEFVNAKVEELTNIQKQLEIYTSKKKLSLQDYGKQQKLQQDYGRLASKMSQLTDLYTQSKLSSSP